MVENSNELKKKVCPFLFGFFVGILFDFVIYFGFIKDSNNLVYKILAGSLIIIIIAIFYWKMCRNPPTCQECIFWFWLGIILAFIVGSTCMWVPPTNAPPVFMSCEEQKTYAIESIKIHTDFVHGLTQGILLARQAFFVVITGLLLYYFVKNGENRIGNGNNTQENRNKLKKETLLLFVLFAAIFCHLHEGINDYWQSEHLNRIYSLTKSLDGTIFPNSKLPTVFEYKELPLTDHEKDKNIIYKFISVFVFTYSLRLNTNSICFYFGILILVFGLVNIVDRSSQDSTRGGERDSRIDGSHDIEHFILRLICKGGSHTDENKSKKQEKKTTKGKF